MITNNFQSCFYAFCHLPYFSPLPFLPVLLFCCSAFLPGFVRALELTYRNPKQSPSLLIHTPIPPGRHCALAERCLYIRTHRKNEAR
ncbi:hypothetical protein BGZ63DRAFT_384444 [Mariannaea sp. PMI_226]|nr:hypothetical protein BGZ63DRAFT_384444 [Mariannaea sp. PMI_226]